MARACGRCLVEIPGVDGRLLAWCKQDRFFVCGRCAKECKRLHGASRRSMGSPAIVSALVILVLFGTVLPFSIAFAYEYSTLSSWQARAVTSIGSAQPGQTVKISGTISEEQGYAYPVALSGQEHAYRGCGWTWDSTARFEVTDGSGTILVTTDRYWEIADGPHPYPYAACQVPETQYWVGDTVVLMGTVERNPQGGVLLQASIVSPDGVNPQPTLFWLALVTPFLVLSVALWVRVGVIGRRRLGMHRAALQGRPTSPLPASAQRRDPGLPWMRTNTLSRVLDHAPYAALFASAPWVVPILFFWFGNAHTQVEYLITASTVWVVDFVSVTIVLVWLQGRVNPSAIALTQDGIHFWYERAADRYEQDPLVSWTDITDVKVVSVGRSRVLALVTRSGRRDLPGLPSSVRDAVLSAWKDRASLPGP